MASNTAFDKAGTVLHESDLVPAQGGKLQIGAPHGNWQMVVVYRGKHDPVCCEAIS